MSEYSCVEKPFLAQMAALGWEVAGQGTGKSLIRGVVILKRQMCDDLKDFNVCLINDLRNIVFHFRRGITPRDTDRLRRFRDKLRYNRDLFNAK